MVLPEATPLVVLTPADVVASIAVSSARAADRDRETPVTREFAARPGNDRSVQLGWALQPVFGVIAFKRDDPRSRDGSGTWLMAGRPSDLAGWRNAMDVLLDAGQAEADRLTEVDAGIFWGTLGAFVTRTDRGKARSEAAGPGRVAARALANERWPNTTTVPKAAVAPDGSPLAQAVVRALAAAALG